MAHHRRDEWSDVWASFAPMGVATGFAIHHTASIPAMRTFDPLYLRRIEHGELAAGYNALAYHTMGMLDGDTAEARPYGAMGAATGGHNGTTIALCAVGYFHGPHHDQPTEQLIDAFAREIHACRELGFATPDSIVRPHTWWTAGTQWATACCGEDFIPMVAEIERRSFNPTAPTRPLLEEDHVLLVGRSQADPNTTYALHPVNGIIAAEFSCPAGQESWGIPPSAAPYANGAGTGRGEMPIRFVLPHVIDWLRAVQNYTLTPPAAPGPVGPGMSEALVRAIVTDVVDGATIRV